jgi:S-adenosylmethionine synthetase
VIINGTGKYVQHGPIADCGITGRKLAVDFYGGNGRIGGGSPWTKDPSKADLTLNLYARYLAV